jgi:hypothetical protein
MDATSPAWTLLAVITGGAISALTSLVIERGRSRREAVARAREGRRDFYLDVVDRVIVLEELIYELERTRDRTSFDALRAAAQPLVHATTRAVVLAPESIRAALARTVTSMGVAPWTAIDPSPEDIDEINHAPFLGARGVLFSAIRDDLGSDRPTLGVVRRARVRLRDARARRRYLKGGIDPY